MLYIRKQPGTGRPQRFFRENVPHPRIYGCGTFLWDTINNVGYAALGVQPLSEDSGKGTPWGASPNGRKLSCNNLPYG